MTTREAELICFDISCVLENIIKMHNNEILCVEDLNNRLLAWRNFREELLKMTDASYDLRYVAFLDLLGFKNLVNQSVNNQTILDIINGALDYICKIRHENYSGIMSMADLGRQVTVFSDSIVISYDASMPGGGFHILMDLIYICNYLLGIGIPVRGGVTVGKLIHDNLKCFGPAMVEAYLMESEKALVPRIIINPDVIEYDLSRPGEANSIEYEEKYLRGIIKKDPFDGKIFLDHLKQYNEFDDPKYYNDFILRTKDLIVNNLNIHAKNRNLTRKYEWLRWYYNETVANVYVESEHFLIL